MGFEDYALFADIEFILKIQFLLLNLSSILLIITPLSRFRDLSSVLRCTANLFNSLLNPDHLLEFLDAPELDKRADVDLSEFLILLQDL